MWLIVCEFHWRMSRDFVSVLLLLLFLLLLSLFIFVILNVPSTYKFVYILFQSGMVMLFSLY